MYPLFKKIKNLKIMNINNHTLPELINLPKQHYILIEFNKEEMINKHN